MGLEKYNHEIVEKNYKRKKRNKALFVFLLFSVVVGIIFFSSFYDGGNITGKAIKSSIDNDSLEITTSLSVPEVFLKDSYPEVVFSINQGGVIYLDDKKVSLNEIENTLVLKDFSGSIKLNSKEISILEGRVSEIRVNNVPINLLDDKRIKIKFIENTPYSFFEISEGIFLDNVFFVSSGTVSVEEDLITLNSEKAIFENYFGSLKVQDKKLILEGSVEELVVEGSSRKISLSKG